MSLFEDKIDLSNPALRVLFERGSGWWEIFYNLVPGRSWTIDSEHVRADDGATAATLLLDIHPGAEILSIVPAADHRNAEEWVIELIGNSLACLKDYLRQDIEDFLANTVDFDHTIELFSCLPAAYSWLYDRELLEGFVAALEDVAGKLARYPDTYLASTIEELAAHALLDEAKIMLEDSEIDEKTARALRGRLDEIHGLAFEDWDVLMLFDRRFDGIADPGAAPAMGFANLHPSDWFKPFRPEGEVVEQSNSSEWDGPRSESSSESSSLELD